MGFRKIVQQHEGAVVTPGPFFLIGAPPRADYQFCGGLEPCPFEATRAGRFCPPSGSPFFPVEFLSHT